MSLGKIALNKSINTMQSYATWMQIVLYTMQNYATWIQIALSYILRLKMFMKTLQVICKKI